MIYHRYHAQRAAKIVAERAQMEREIAEIRGTAPAPVAQPEPVAVVSKPAPAPQNNQQHQRNDQKRR